jgi:hypothetical protein
MVTAVNISDLGYPERADCLSASKMKKYVDESSKPEAMDYVNPDHSSNKCKLKTSGLSFDVLTQNSDVQKHKQAWCQYQPLKCVADGFSQLAQEEQQQEQIVEQQQQPVQQTNNNNTGVAFLSSSSSSVLCMFMFMMMMSRR